jgi:polar amino acid transport system substrate-binding protein
MKKMIILLLMASSIFAAQVVELAGDKSYPPYSYSQDGQAKGLYVDILKTAFDKMPEYSLKLNMVAFKRAINMTKQGKIIAFFPPYFSEKRSVWMTFSEPLLDENTIIFAKQKELLKKLKFPDDFYGKTVCLNRGFSHTVMGGDKFEQAIKDNKLKLVTGKSNKACLNRVNRGVADFYINDQLIDISAFPSIKKGMSVKANFGHLGFTLKDKNYPFSKNFQKRFNKVIKEMNQNGEIEKIIQKYK